MMLIESGILLKNMLVVIYAKILHHSFIQQFTKTLNRFFTYLEQTKIWKLAYRFDLSN